MFGVFLSARLLGVFKMYKTFSWEQGADWIFPLLSNYHHNIYEAFMSIFMVTGL